jgi:cell division initiation protein
MDLSPRLLTEVEFKEQWRGYSPTEVDQFLASVATAVGDLQHRLHEAVDRAMRAEEKLLERTDDDEVRRTLVLAQRTASSAVEEAKAEAERIVAEARLQATEESTTLAEQARAEADALTERRARLQADVDALEAYVSQQRERLREELTRQLAALDEASFGLAAPPVESAAALEPPASEESRPDELAGARADLADALRQAGVEPLEPLEPLAPVPAADEPTGRPALYDADADESGEIVLPRDDATQAFDVVDLDAEGNGEGDATGEHDALAWAAAPAEPAATLDVDDEDDSDPFLAELRRAVNDDAPLGPRDESLPLAFSPDEDAVPSGRFRRRRGR